MTSKNLLPDPPIKKNQLAIDGESRSNLSALDALLDTGQKRGVGLDNWGLFFHRLLLSYQIASVQNGTLMLEGSGGMHKGGFSGAVLKPLLCGGLVRGTFAG